MLQKIHIQNFRNFKSKTFSFSDSITIIVGPNATGKTNILESIFLLSTGKSFKAKIEEEMVKYGEDLARVEAYINDNKLEVVITKGELRKISRKKLLVNGVPKRLIDFAKNFHLVLFSPHDLDLVTESPSIRRKFLDVVLSQSDYEYRRSVLSYEKGLRQRNKLLLRIREENISRSQLFFWNNLLIKNGDYIAKKREDFIDFVNMSENFNGKEYELAYDKSAISEGRLEQYKEEEVAAATTLVGPHRDDFTFLEEGRELSSYGSRGEQRMAVLWIKLTQLAYLEEKLTISGSGKEKPTLLLDDIFSELDHEHRDIVIKKAKNQQTIITTADPHFVSKFLGVEKIELG